MLCFNVACSVSNLSIPHGDRVMFFPLLPSYDAGNEGHQVGVNSNLIYANCYYNPFSLPIEGSYNDYGSLEDITENDNTKAIEKFFGITIQQFVDCVTGNHRSWHDHFSGVHEAYAIDKKLLGNYDVQLSVKLLEKLGFVNVKGGYWKFGKLPYEVKLKPAEGKNDYVGFILYNNAGTIIFETDEHCYNAKETLFEQFNRATNYYLGITPENQERVGLLTRLSGMFVLKDIYDGLSQHNSARTKNSWHNGTVASGYLTAAVLLDLGFELKKAQVQSPRFNDRKCDIYVKSGSAVEVALEPFGSTLIKGKNKTDVYRVHQFTDVWEDMTGEKLDIKKYETMFVIDEQYETYKARLVNAEKLSKAKKIKGNDKLDKSLAELEMMMASMRFSNTHLGGFFKDWEHFEDLYKPFIAKGKLKEDIRWYTLFYTSMYSNNRFFFPAMNGEQHGNDEESAFLLRTALKIVEARLKRREEDEI